MTQAIATLIDGHAFQARQFWWRAAQLLDPHSPILRVAFECGPKSFDDIWVEYDPTRAPSDQFGRPLLREHIQCKWHASPGSYTYTDLTLPAFVNAETFSLLQRAHRAQIDHAPRGEGARFRLLTNWRLAKDDPLRDLIGNRSGALRTERLVEGKTARSRMGALRKHWRDHLGIDDEALLRLSNTLAFSEASDTLDDWRAHLDARFALVGLRRVPPNESAFPYDGLVYAWLGQGRIEFDRVQFEQTCKREGLLVGNAAPRPRTIGVKSFEHAVDRLEDRCVKVLDLVPVFDERFIRSEDDWAQSLYPQLKTFLLEAAKAEEHLRLVLDAHATLAYAAGTVLDLKSGRAVDIEQRAPIRQIWSADDSAPDSLWPAMTYEIVEFGSGGGEMAVAVALTHDISADVQDYLKREVPSVSRLLVCRPDGGVGPRSVACGRHAFDLAQSMAATVKRERQQTASQATHVFVAGPNAFTFFAGQHHRTMGRMKLYEYDFEGQRSGTYLPSLTLPLPIA